MAEAFLGDSHGADAIPHEVGGQSMGSLKDLPEWSVVPASNHGPEKHLASLRINDPRVRDANGRDVGKLT